MKKSSPAEAVFTYVTERATSLNKAQIQDEFPETDLPFPTRFEWLRDSSDYEFLSDGKYFLFHHSDNYQDQFVLSGSDRVNVWIQRIDRSAPQYENGISAITEVILYPTAYCPLKCSHCRFSSPFLAEGDVYNNPKLFLSPDIVQKSIDFINQLKHLQILSIGGGGEPFSKMSTILDLIRETHVPKISIITGAYWIKDRDFTRGVLLSLQEAADQQKLYRRLELNVSIDKQHILQLQDINDRYIMDLFAVYTELKTGGLLNNIDLHIRTLSKMGEIVNDDLVMRSVYIFMQPKDDWSVINPSKGAFKRDGKTIFHVSYNEYDRRTEKNLDYIQVLIRRIEQDKIEDAYLDKFLINYDGRVSIGKYYPAILLGDLKKTSPTDIIVHAERKFLYHIVKKSGLKRTLKYMSEISPDYLEKFGQKYFATELLEVIANDDALVLYIYLRYLFDERLDDNLLVEMGVNLGEITTLHERYKEILRSKKPWNIEIRRNWGLSLSEDNTLSLNDYHNNKFGKIHQILEFLNPWWDIRDEAERLQMIQKVACIKNLDEIMDFTQREFGRKYDQQIHIRSIYIVGSYSYSLSTHYKPWDLDIEILIDNPGICDACHYLQLFKYENTFCGGTNVPRTINIWLISSERINPTTGNAVDIDVAFNTTRGLPLYGKKFIQAPPPLIERLKMASFYANLILTIYSERNLSFLLNRQQELYALLGQAALIANTSPEYLLRHPHISSIDKKYLDDIQTILRRFLGKDPNVYQQQLREMTRTMDNYLLNETEDEDLGFYKNTITAQIFEDAVEKKKKIFNLLTALYRLLSNEIEPLPVKGSRKWVYQIMAATNRCRTIGIQQMIPNMSEIDFSLAAALSYKGIDPTPLAMLWEGLSGNLSLNYEQKEIVTRGLAANFVTPRESLLSIFDQSLSSPRVLAGFLENWCCPNGIISYIEKQNDDRIQLLYEKRQEKVRAIETLIQTGYSFQNGEAISSIIKKIRNQDRPSDALRDRAYYVMIDSIEQKAKSIVEFAEQDLLDDIVRTSSKYYDRYLWHATGRMTLSGERDLLAMQIAQIIEEIALLYISTYELRPDEFSQDDVQSFVESIFGLFKGQTQQNQNLDRLISYFGLFRCNTEIIKLKEFANHLSVELNHEDISFKDLLELEELFSWYALNVLLMNERDFDYQYLLSTFSDVLRSKLLSDVYSDRYVSYRTKALRFELFESLFFKNGKKTPLFFGLVRHYELVKRFFLNQGSLIGSIEFHPSGKCNLSCDHCIFGELLDVHKRFSLKDVEIIDSIESIHDFIVKHGINPGEVELKFGGIFSEPLHYQTKNGVAAAIHQAVEYGFKVGLITNGINMEPDVAHSLAGINKKSAYYVNISLDAGTWQTMKLIKLPKVSDRLAEKIFSKTIQNISYLTALRKDGDSSIGIHISYVIQSRNIAFEDLTNVVKIASETGVDSLRFRHINRKSDFSPTTDQLRRFYQYIQQLKLRNSHHDLLIVILGELDETIEGLPKVGTKIEQPKKYKKCRVSYIRTAIGSDGGIYPCEHRCFKGGGLLGYVADGFGNVRDGEKTKTAFEAINPSSDPHCRYCSQYNHFLNEIMDVIATEYERDNNIFAWLENEYLNTKDTLENEDSGFRWEKKLLKRSIKKTTKEAHLALGILHEHLARVAKDVNFRRDVASFVNKKSVYPKVPSRMTSLDIMHIYCSAHQRKTSDMDEPKSFFGYTIGEDYNPDYFLRTSFRDEEFYVLLRYLTLSFSGRRSVPVSDQRHLNDFLIDLMKLFLGEHFEETIPSGLPEYLTEEYLDLLNVILSLSYPYFQANIKHLAQLHAPYLIRDRIRNIYNRAQTRGLYKNIVGFSSFYKFSTDLMLKVVLAQIRFLRNGYIRHLGQQSYVVLEIMQNTYQNFLEESGLDRPLPIILLRDGEPLTHIFTGLTSGFGINPVHVNFNRISTMTDSEQEEFASIGLGQRNEYAQIFFGRQSKIFTSFLPFDSEISLNHHIAAEAENIVRSWLLDQWKSALSANGHQERLNHIDEWEKEFYRLLPRVWLVLMTKKIHELRDSDPEIKQKMDELYYQFIPTKVRQNPHIDIVFLDSGFKGTLPVLLASLVLIYDIEEKKEDVVEVLTDAGSSVKAILSFHLRAQIFLYAATHSLERVIPNAGFGRWGYGGVHFLDSLPNQGDFRGLDWRGRPQLVKTNEIQQYLTGIIFSDLVTDKKSYTSIRKVHEHEEFVEQVLKDIPNNHSRVIFYIDLDNVVIHPIGYLGSEAWMRDGNFAIPDHLSEKKTEFYKHTMIAKQRLCKRQAYEVILDVWDLRQRFEARFPRRENQVIAFTARRKDVDYEATMFLLTSLGMKGAFDDFSFSEKTFSKKVDRLSEDFNRRGVQLNGSDADTIILIDDSSHNLIPIAQLFGQRLLLYHMQEGSNNYRSRSASWFLSRAIEFEQNYESSKAVESILNVANTRGIPFTSEEKKWVLHSVINEGTLVEHRFLQVFE
ncbi:MAG: hypothetical protein GY797_12790 [Deltaproteobacteria bacterium]|nr:hypothetical protein [Deltaproteobacteria bacterium]